MIDLHCHILPGLDDGPADLEHSVEMAHQAQDDGIELICATPHIRHDHDVRIHELPDRLAVLNEALARSGLATRASSGGEVAETIVEHLTDQELRAVSLGGGGKWILLEPKAGPLSDTLDHAVVALHHRGFRCLIAHPERHLGRDLLERTARLIREGALVQATAATMFDEKAAKGMRTLAEAGLIHVLASDSHHPRFGREVRIAQGLDVLAQVAELAPHLDWVARTGPEAMIAGEDVDPPFGPAAHLT